MHVAGSESWRVSVDLPDLMHLPLYTRDAAGLEVPVGGSVPPPLSGVAPRTTAWSEPLRSSAASEWRSWWATAIECELECRSLMRRRFAGGTSERPSRLEILACRERAQHLHGEALPTIIDGLRGEARAWFQERKPAWASQLHIPKCAGAVADEVADLLDMPIGRVTAEITVLFVEGAWWRHVKRGILLCSDAVLADDELIAPVLRENLLLAAP
jgi:hypothetical protein